MSPQLPLTPVNSQLTIDKILLLLQIQLHPHIAHVTLKLRVLVQTASSLTQCQYPLG